MAYTLYEEDMLANLASYFGSNFEAIITGIAAQEDDGIVLPDFRSIAQGEADIFRLNAYPALLLFPEEIVYESLTTKSDSLNVLVNAIVVLRGAVTENLVTKALRYVAGVRELFDADRTAGATMDRVSVQRVRFNPRPPGSEDFAVTEIILACSKEVSR